MNLYEPLDNALQILAVVAAALALVIRLTWGLTDPEHDPAQNRFNLAVFAGAFALLIAARALLYYLSFRS